jgi:hypothetical protein
LRNTVRQRFPDRDEEIITELFHAELEAECNRVSAIGAVEEAFKADLRRFLPSISEVDVSKIGTGLVATVYFHPRIVETRTGGDFGVVFIRPDVRYANYSYPTLEIESDYQRGLLCQAKIFRRDSSWGGLTAKQKAVLQERLQHLSLVLYRYADQNGARRELGPFEWQLTVNASVDDIVDWLRSDNFPNLQSSREILIKLALGRIGTENKRVISEFIAPSLRPSFEIRIHWRNRPDPGRTLHLRNFTAVERHVFAR